MEIGSTLHLQHKVSDKIEEYYCKIIEKKGKYIFIDFPIHELTKRTTYFSENTSFRAIFIGKDNLVYYFKTKILGKVKLRVPALVIQLPENKNLKVIQRREFVRVKNAIDIAVHCPENRFEPFTTTTVDISGGGLAFYLPKKNIDERNKELNIWMAFQMQSGEFQYIFSKVELVRLNLLKNKLEICSVKFINISKQAQQKIIYYCFEKQREARKKELK